MIKLPYKISAFLAAAIIAFSPLTATAMYVPGGSTSNNIGRPDFRGYFTNLFKNGANDAGPLWTDGLRNPDGSWVTTVDQYLAFMHNSLYDNSNGGFNRNAAAAAFTIAFMLNGNNVSIYGNSYANGLAYARDATNYAKWENLIRQYDAANKAGLGWGVKFNEPETICRPYYQGNLDYQSFDVFYYRVDGALDDCDNDPSVEFRTPSGEYFFLLMVCGNPYGTIVPLTGGYGVDVSIGPDVTAAPGDTITLTVGLHNTSTSMPVPSGGRLEAYQLTTKMDTPCGPGICPLSGAAQSDLSGGISTVHGFDPNGDIQNLPAWYWSTNAIPVGGNTTGTFQIHISTTATSGTFPMTACFVPADNAGGSHCDQVNITILATRQPALVGENGDIHAGGHVAVSGTCTQFGGSANVQTNGGSYGDYIISASGSISTNINSNGAGGGTTLKLGGVGAGGGYAEICRPDLSALADAYGGTIQPLAGPNVNLSALAGGVYRYVGGAPLVLSGTINQTITIISQSAPVRFNSNVTVNVSINADLNALPSLGIITQGVGPNGDIQIGAGVTQLDAYLFSSNGTIDTCIDHSSACTNGLVVNGFLMGHDINFGRLGPANSAGNPIAERISLTPQIYFNPPILFGGTAGNINLTNEGEKQPLF